MSLIDLDPKDYPATLDFLRNLNFLQGAADADLRGILIRLQQQSFPAGRTILFQGEIANQLFMIRGGGVVISTNNKGSRLILAELKAPAYFGEISLLRPTSATATVVAGNDGADLLILTNDAFLELEKRIPTLRQRLQGVIDARLAEKQKAKEADEIA